ncbi:hypothetical protein F5Y12DRAFT_138904 [Xylaria sp. FL1777]|nr:hypothetical protein F5Y12DRAFT_138904 [Xylaria sp. FL1777]
MASCADATEGRNEIKSSTTAVSTASPCCSCCCSGCDDQPTAVSNPELTYAPGMEDVSYSSYSDHGAGGSSKRELACCSDEGSCNDIEGKTAVKDTIPVTTQGCRDACCDFSKEDNVCEQPVPSSKPACEDQCCALDSPTFAAPSCYQGRPTPCCDETCIDRLVSRERIAGTKRTVAASTSSKKSASLREEYSIRLAALGCLCRALIALGQESCCSTKQASYASRKKSSAARKKSREKVSAARNESCCVSSTCKASRIQIATLIGISGCVE